MERELKCEIVKDLLPLYVDGMVSDVSKKSIENHLENCADCNEAYRNMAFHLEMETPPDEVPDIKRFLNKTKKMYFLYAFGGLSLIAVIVCLIVDLAVNKKITWSLIVGSACLFADVLIYVFFNSKKNKGINALSVISIGTFCLLSMIQIACYCLMRTGSVWIFRYGLPILLIWIIVLWIPVLARNFLKWNLWDCIALFMLLLAAGNYITKLVTGDYTWSDVLNMRGFMVDAFGEVIGFVVFAMIGRVKKWRK